MIAAPHHICDRERANGRFSATLALTANERNFAMAAPYLNHRAITRQRLSHAKVTGRPCKNCGGRLRYGRSYSCVRCSDVRTKSRKSTKAYKLYARNYWMKKRYGIDFAEMTRLLSLQGGKCAICRTSEPGHAMVDHCHKSDSVRKILCNSCNVGLGGFKDKIGNLKAAILYLRRHQRNRRQPRRAA